MKSVTGMGEPGIAAAPSRRKWRFWRREQGQSLIEVALFIPVFTLMVCYAVDFGYFFIVAASLTSSARNAAEYGTQGFLSATQSSLPAGGPITSNLSISGMAVADISSLVNASTATKVQVCTQGSGNPAPAAVCNPYGSGNIPGSWTPDRDPESTFFGITRVDVAYTVSPPIRLSFFSFPLVPSLNFHRMAEMRTIN